MAGPNAQCVRSLSRTGRTVSFARPSRTLSSRPARKRGELSVLAGSWALYAAGRIWELEILPSQTPGVHARFPWIPMRAYQESVQVIGPGGRTWQGAAALEQIIDLMPKGRLLTWVFSIPFVRPLAERFYRWFARNRYKMGCGAHCQLRAADLVYGDK